MAADVKVSEETGMALTPVMETPNWLTPEEVAKSRDSSFATNAAPPVITIVQGNAKREIAEKFDQGSVIAMPLEVEIAVKGQPFDFIPLTMWSLYTGWTPRQRAAGVPPFVATSRDPTSIEARKARAFVKEPSTEYNCEVQWRETLCFAVYLLNSEVKTPCIMMFGSTGFKAGQTLALWVMSKEKFVPPYAQIYSGSTELKSNNQGTWYTLGVSPPEGRPSVLQDANLGAELRELSKSLRERMQTDFAAHLRDADSGQQAESGQDQF